MGHVTKYRQVFLKKNKCTADEFERAYVQFMDSNPTPANYRTFAERWGITIHPGMNDKDTEAILSVNIAAIKVMAESEDEAYTVIRRIMAAVH